MPSLTDAELLEQIIARNRRDSAKTFSPGCKGQSLVDTMEWEWLHKKVVLLESENERLRQGQGIAAKD